jgi:Tol biopolymer transport system component
VDLLWPFYPLLKRRLVWVDAQGRESPVGTPEGPYLAPRLSPDDKRIAVFLHPSQDQDVWVHEPPEGPSLRMTFGGSNAFPIWTPDGSRLTLSRALQSVAQLHRVVSTGGQHEPEILESADQSRLPADWTPDGHTLVFVQEVADKPNDIWALTREGTTWRASPVVRSRFSDDEPALSPDGRWLAYVSDESGQPEVYVQPFPAPGKRHQISNNGGREPLWARDGRTLYYLVPSTPGAAGQTVTAVPVTGATGFTSGMPKPLFQTQYGGTKPVRGYDIAKDGRFLMALVEPVTIPAATHLDIIQNWSMDLLQKVPSRTRR